MRLLSDNRHLWLLGLVYGLAAAAALWLTRFDSGVAFLWGANAILIAALVRTGLQRWWAPLLVCGVVGGTLTGLLGLGWAAALPFAVVNLGESACAAWIMRSQPRERDTLDSMRWFARYVVAAGVVGPIVAAILATGSLLLLGRFTSDAIVNLFTGHSLGNLTFVPLALMFTGRRQQHEAWTVLAGRPVEAAALLIIVLVVSGGVFAQASNPLLFLPVMAIILVTFRLGRVGAVLAVALLAVVGGVLTAVGEGPMHLVALDDIAARMQFFQFYLAVTVLTVLPVSADLHHRKLLLRRVRLSEERFRMMAEHSSDLMMHIGNDGRFRYMSPSMQQIGGYDPATLIGTPSSALIAPDYLEMVRREHWGTMEEPGRTRRYQYMGVMADGSQRWFETHSRAIIDEDGQSDGVLSIARDVTESRLREQRLTDAAYTDYLTGLPNRRALLLIVGQRKRTAGTGDDCIVLLDIDHFKKINDSFGHDAGDEVLRAFSLLARGGLRSGDLMARLGGEEFVVFFPGTTKDEALAVCNRIRALVSSAPILVGPHAIRFTVSGGVAALGEGGIEQALTAADAALYEAKNGGRNRLALAA